MRSSRRIPLWLAPASVVLLLVLGASWLSGRTAPVFHGTTFEEVAPAPDFRLVDQEGRRVTRDSLAGAPALLFFGYTRCPDVCPLTLSRLVRAAERARVPDTQIVLVTVDPRHDAPPVLARYVGRFGPRVRGLSGDSAAVAAAMAGYGAYTLPPGQHARHRGSPGAPAAVGHSSVVYGLDRHGNLRVVMTEGAPEGHLRDDIRTLSRL